MTIMEKLHVKTANIELTCTEISGLWAIYIQETMTKCLLIYFLHHLQDADILPLANKSLHITQDRLDKIKRFFEKENFPVPAGVSEGDLNLSAPPLFRDPFALSFIYMFNRLNMINFGFTASSNVRLDVLDFFTECLHTSTEVFGEAVKMLLEKGLYDRPPKINYPEKIEYVKSESFLSGLFGDKRPMNAIELSEMFFNIERNYFSVILTLGFAQVMEDKKLKEFILRGKSISEKQIEVFNRMLMDEDFLGTVSVTMEVTDSTISPFSDKLILLLIHVLNPIDITLLSHALSMSMRTDLAANYTKFIAEVMAYAKDAFDIVVERGWLEQPPLATDRDKLIHS